MHKQTKNQKTLRQNSETYLTKSEISKILKPWKVEQNFPKNPYNLKTIKLSCFPTFFFCTLSKENNNTFSLYVTIPILFVK